ncbi:MAG: hypothetical protein RI894_534, partial [Bacteroidota bacterium]
MSYDIAYHLTGLQKRRYLYTAAYISSR